MRTKPKLLFISQLPPRFTGVPIHSSQLLGGLARRGYGAYAIAPIPPAVPVAQRRCAATADIDIQWLELEDIGLDTRNPSSMAAFYRDATAVAAILPDAIARIRPDVIVPALNQFVPGIPALAHAHHLPCVVIAHNVLSRRFGGTFRDDIAALQLDEYRKADRIIAVADHVAASLRQSDCESVASVPNAVDTRNFCPGRSTPALRGRLGIAADDSVVLHASRLVAIKRPLDVIAAAASSLRHDRRLQFIIAGEGPGLPAMRAAAGQAGIADRVRFLGSVTADDMPDLYRLSDMVLMPSEAEGLSLVCLEALSAGCVLLASDIPAAREIVADGNTGFLFPVGDVAAMADLILRNAAESGLRSRVGRNARAWSLQRPSPDDNIATVAALFDDVVTTHKDRSRTVA